MKLLVAGGAGYLGSVLIPRLLDRGYDVDVVELFWFGNHLPNQVGILNKDIFHLSVEDLKPYDQVIFLAGLSNDPMAEYSPSKNFVLNAAAPAYLGYIAKIAKVKRYIYASSCSVYGYTENELYDETRPVGSSYPYGISKLQGEQAALQLTNDEFSVICLRKGTISGYSPRMRLDLIVNTMFKTALRDGVITVNNPSIWRPILSIEDAATAYIRAVEANAKISGVFNLASGNYTVGEVADVVRSRIEDRLDVRINLNIRHVQDFRNYKVSVDKAANVLSFHPTGDVKSIVDNLIENVSKFQDWDNPLYSNILTFKELDTKVEVPAMVVCTMNIAVIGANGQLGSDVVSAFAESQDTVDSMTHAEIEIGKLESVRTRLEKSRPAIVVNTAAMHHVENCERDPEQAYSINATGVRNLALVTRDLGVPLIHVSTDYVFDGKKNAPYVEDDAPLPLNVYGNSKLAGEYHARTINPRHFVLRTSALYGKHPCRAKGGRNFVDLMLELARTRDRVRVVNDEFVSPTPTIDLAREIVCLSRTDAYGLYHASSENSCSWYEFAEEIFSLAGVDVKLEAAAPGEFPAKAPRPRYSVLENRELKSIGLNLFTSWKVGLQRYLLESGIAAPAAR